MKKKSIQFCAGINTEEDIPAAMTALKSFMKKQGYDGEGLEPRITWDDSHKIGRLDIFVIERI